MYAGVPRAVPASVPAWLSAEAGCSVGSSERAVPPLRSRPTTFARSEPTDRDDARVLQASRDFCLQQEACPALGHVGVLLPDLLQSHLAVQFVVERHGHLAEAARGVRPHNTEAQA